MTNLLADQIGPIPPTDPDDLAAAARLVARQPDGDELAAALGLEVTT